MSAKTRLSKQVIAYASRLAPEQRRALKRALKELGAGRGDIGALCDNLEGYYRLRVGRHRLIFLYAEDGSIDVIFMEARSLVYEVFAAEFAELLAPDEEPPDPS